MAETFYLQKAAFEQIVAHARQGFPYEVCGFLAGSVLGQALQVRAATNVATNPHVAYAIAPEETLAALLEFESDGHKITGVYHSHPRYPAVPSQVDMKLADLPNAFYLIISVQERPPTDLDFELRAYRIINNKKTYQVQLELID